MPMGLADLYHHPDNVIGYADHLFNQQTPSNDLSCMIDWGWGGKIIGVEMDNYWFTAHINLFSIICRMHALKILGL